MPTGACRSTVRASALNPYLLRYLTGNIQITLDSTSKRTTGRRISYVAAPYATTTTSGGPSSDNLTVATDVTARRTLEISTLINTGSSSKIVSFSQVVSYTNEQVYSRDGLNEVRDFELGEIGRAHV